MNFHQIATPELGVDEARCYIFFFRERDKFSAYIVLYMPHSERRLYYTYSSNPFSEIDLPKVEEVARAFGEEMGFFLDEKSFASSSIAEKNLWIDEQPLFGFKTPEELALADAIRMSEAAEVPAEEQVPTPVLAVDEHTSTVAAAPAPSVVPPTPLAPEHQPVTGAPAAQPTPAVPIYQPAPAQPAPPVYYQPVSPPPTAQPTPAAPSYYQPVPTAPTAQPTPAAPQYYQPAPTAPAAPQMPPQPLHQKEIEIESQVEVDGEEEVDVRPPLQKQKSAAAPRSTAEKAKAAGAAQRTTRPVRSNPLEEEHRAAQKNPPQAPKQPHKKETRSAPGVVGREMEALARLMASF